MDFFKVSPTIKCYRCQGHGHIDVNCSSPEGIAIVNGMPVANPKPESDEFIYRPNEVDSGVDEEITDDDIGFHCIRPTSSNYLLVVRCALSQPKEKNDWRWTTMFHTFTMIGGKSCKVIVDSRSSSIVYNNCKVWAESCFPFLSL